MFADNFIFMTTPLMTLFLLFALSSCKGPADKLNSDSKVIDNEIGRLKINDVTIAFETTGMGDTTLLVVHGLIAF